MTINSMFLIAVFTGILTSPGGALLPALVCVIPVTAHPLRFEITCRRLLIEVVELSDSIVNLPLNLSVLFEVIDLG